MVRSLLVGSLALALASCAAPPRKETKPFPKLFRSGASHHSIGIPREAPPGESREEVRAHPDKPPPPSLEEVEAAIRSFQRQRTAQGPAADTAWEPFLQTVFDYMDQPVERLSFSPLIRARVAAEFEMDGEQRKPGGADPELEKLVADLLMHIDYRVRKMRSLTGESQATLRMSQDGKLSWPLAFGLITSGFGPRKDPLDRNRQQFHSGIDLAAPPHEPVYAAAAGTVVFVGWNAGYGRMVRIRHGEHQETVYAHLAASLVKEEEEVARGQVLGLLGRSGRTTGHHLHFEVSVDDQPADPMEHLMPAPMSFSDMNPGILFGEPEEP